MQTGSQWRLHVAHIQSAHPQWLPQTHRRSWPPPVRPIRPLQLTTSLDVGGRISKKSEPDSRWWWNIQKILHHWEHSWHLKKLGSWSVPFHHLGSGALLHKFSEGILELDWLPQGLSWWLLWRWSPALRCCTWGPDEFASEPKAVHLPLSDIFWPSPKLVDLGPKSSELGPEWLGSSLAELLWPAVSPGPWQRILGWHAKHLDLRHSLRLTLPCQGSEWLPPPRLLVLTWSKSLGTSVPPLWWLQGGQWWKCRRHRSWPSHTECLARFLLLFQLLPDAKGLAQNPAASTAAWSFLLLSFLLLLQNFSSRYLCKVPTILEIFSTHRPLFLACKVFQVASSLSWQRW